MSEENKTVELKDEELEKITGGYGPPIRRPDGAPSCWEQRQNAGVNYAAAQKPGCQSCPFTNPNHNMCTGQFYNVQHYTV